VREKTDARTTPRNSGGYGVRQAGHTHFCACFALCLLCFTSKRPASQSVPRKPETAITPYWKHLSLPTVTLLSPHSQYSLLSFTPVACNHVVQSIRQVPYSHILCFVMSLALLSLAGTLGWCAYQAYPPDFPSNRCNHPVPLSSHLLFSLCPPSSTCIPRPWIVTAWPQSSAFARRKQRSWSGALSPQVLHHTLPAGFQYITNRSVF